MGFLSSITNAAKGALTGGASSGGSPWGALIGAGASLAGSYLSANAVSSAAGVSKKSAREQMKFQREQNQKQMDFQTGANQKAMDFSQRMSNTAHQREIADLQAAGLNPILAAKYGGSSTPTGVTSGGTSSSGAGYAKGVPNYEGVSNSAKAYNNANAIQAQTINTKLQSGLLERDNVKADMEIDTLTKNPWMNILRLLGNVDPATAMAAMAIQAKDVETGGEASSAKSYGTKYGKFKGIKPIQLTTEQMSKRKTNHPYDFKGSNARKIRNRRKNLKGQFPGEYN